MLPILYRLVRSGSGGASGGDDQVITVIDILIPYQEVNHPYLVLRRLNQCRRSAVTEEWKGRSIRGIGKVAVLLCRYQQNPLIQSALNEPSSDL